MSFTQAIVMARPARHSSALTKNAAFTPKRPACKASVLDWAAFVATVDTDIRMAVPSEPATWRNVLFTEVPWLSTPLSSAFMAQVVIGMFTSDMENMRTV